MFVVIDVVAVVVVVVRVVVAAVEVVAVNDATLVRLLFIVIVQLHITFYQKVNKPKYSRPSLFEITRASFL